jgi:hypothetical protein
MPALELKPLEDWPAIVQAADATDVGGEYEKQAYMFRGHEDADWDLKPSLHRAATRDGKDPLPAPAALLELERTATSRFQALAACHLPHAAFAMAKTEFEWWPLMRHYGVPTRLLDWTASFYVATYFAVSRAPDKDGAVYVLHAATLDERMKALHGNNGDFSATVKKVKATYENADAPHALFLFSRKTALLDREAAQQSVFMVGLNVATNPEGVIAESIPQGGNPVLAAKYRIPAAQKPIVMRRLRKMNVQASSLFPGLDGIGRHVDEVVRNRIEVLPQ